MLQVALLEASLSGLARIAGLSCDRRSDVGLGSIVSAALPLPSGRTCILEEHEAATGEQAGVLIMAVPSTDTSAVLDDVLQYFGLDETHVKWKADRRFLEYGPTVCLLDNHVEPLAQRLSLTYERGIDPNAGEYLAAEIEGIDGRGYLLLELASSGRSHGGLSVQCGWSDDPRAAFDSVLATLDVSESEVKWRPDPAG